jgi:tRNA 2-thiouridine synthesizing protein A
MRGKIPRVRWHRVARAVTFTARKPGHDAGRVADTTGSATAGGAPEAGHVALPQPDAVRDFGAAGCEEGVLIQIRNALARLQVGQILEIRSTDPGAREDFPAWCRLTAQEYLGAADSRYFVRKR